MANKVFVVIDGNSVVHRAFHAMPALTNHAGQPVGAVHGFVLALYKAVEDFRPDYMAVCFDTKGGTFRHREFKDYKAQRPKTDPELIPQLKIAQDLLKGMGIAAFAKSDFEADDLIASVIKWARSDSRGTNIDFYVLTGDYDSLQLVDECVKVFIVNRGIKNAVLYDKHKVKESFGVFPKQIPAFKALSGDASDNIPGAPGIGPKAAIQILEKCGSLENAYEAAFGDSESLCLGSGVRFKKIKNILLENKDMILGFQKLTTMRDDAPVGEVLSECAFNNFAGDTPRETLLNLGLTRLAQRLPQGKISRNGTLF